MPLAMQVELIRKKRVVFDLSSVKRLATNHGSVDTVAGLLTCRESAAQALFLVRRLGSVARAHRYWWNLEVGA